MDEQTLRTQIAQIVVGVTNAGRTGTAEECVTTQIIAVNQLLAMHHLEESFYRVKQFHIATGAIIQGGLFDEDELQLRLDLIKEEWKEVQKAVKDWNANPSVENLCAISKELADLDYVVQGFLVAAGLPGVAIEKEVHRSNMTKLLPNGQALKREDGKILKGPNYEEADIAAVLERAGILWQSTRRDDEDAPLEYEIEDSFLGGGL